MLSTKQRSILYHYFFLLWYDMVGDRTHYSLTTRRTLYHWATVTLKLITWYMPTSTIPHLVHTGRSPYTPTHMVQTQLSYRQDAWNDIRCSDKCGKSMKCQILHEGLATDTLKVQSSDCPKLHCALWHYVISRLLLDYTSFQVRQTGCRHFNYQYNIKE